MLEKHQKRRRSRERKTTLDQKIQYGQKKMLPQRLQVGGGVADTSDVRFQVCQSFVFSPEEGIPC